jgi:hypothetical protein
VLSRCRKREISIPITVSAKHFHITMQKIKNPPLGGFFCAPISAAFVPQDGNFTLVKAVKRSPGQARPVNQLFFSHQESGSMGF